MRPTRYRRHSTTFKLELVRAYLNGEGGYKTIARKHDISHALLMLWVEKYQRGDHSSAFAIFGRGGPTRHGFSASGHRIKAAGCKLVPPATR
jgi:transposase-like protein